MHLWKHQPTILSYKVGKPNQYFIKPSIYIAPPLLNQETSPPPNAAAGSGTPLVTTCGTTPLCWLRNVAYHSSMKCHYYTPNKLPLIININVCSHNYSWIWHFYVGYQKRNMPRHRLALKVHQGYSASGTKQKPRDNSTKSLAPRLYIGQIKLPITMDLDK